MSTAVSMTVANELQGIGAVLGSSEYQRSKTAASLRRTLSADMSSTKWLEKNGFCPLKRIASSEDLQVAANEDASKLERHSHFDIRNSTQVDEETKKEEEPPGQTDIWSSIVSQKISPVSTPYVHPLTKRARSLSQQSLEICTESLGSETGSDGFSSVPPSDTSDEEQEEEQEEEEVKETPIVHKQELGVVNYNSYAIKKSPARSFPPPLPSLSKSGLHMRSRRIDGRLVLEAVSAPPPSHNVFQSQREGGRLLLTLANPKFNETKNTELTKESGGENCKSKIKTQKDEEEEEDMFREVEDEDSEFEEEEEDEEEEESEEVMERNIVLEMKVSQPTKKVPTGVINVHRSAFMVNKLVGLTNIDPTWSAKLGDDNQTPLTQSLPPQPRVTRLIPSSTTTASSFNTYNYCWRPKAVSTPTVCTHPLTQNQPLLNKNNRFHLPKNLNSQEQQEVVLMRGDYLVPMFKGCKEPRRSLLAWEPYCIATS